MADDAKGSKLKVLDTVLVGGAVVAAVFVALWIVGAVLGLVLFAFKIIVLVVLVAVAIRVVHFFTRRDRD
jgi:hypothetical protein